MWNLDPSKMCRHHLLGEHVEMHMFIGSLAHNKNIIGYINSGLVCVSYICSRHDILAAEMIKRGYKHNSPLHMPKILPDYLTPELYNRNYISIDRNYLEIIKRCEECEF